MNTLELNKDQQELFNAIAGLDRESLEKVKKYV